MKNWIAENSKWLYPSLTFIGGLLLGFYLAVLRYESHTEIIETKIMELKDDIHDLKIIIQNEVLTK